MDEKKITFMVGKNVVSREQFMEGPFSEEERKKLDEQLKKLEEEALTADPIEGFELDSAIIAVADDKGGKEN